MARLEMKFLGGLTLQQDGVSLADVKSQKGQALLCYLAFSQKQVSRPYLAALFWPDMPESRALRNLRKVLQRLQPFKPYLVITREAVAFDREADSWLDVVEFEVGTAAKKEISHLQKAISLYQGDFLDGFMLADAPLFEEWVLAQRARLREVALAALHRLVEHFGGEGEYETAVAYARQRLTIEPWHEETHRELMRLLALSGQRSAALAQYESCRRLLADELGIAPTVETVQLVEQIKAGELGKGAEPALSTLSGSRRAKGERGSRGEGLPLHNLPPQMTPFVGREAELARLGQLLTEPDVHLITILGSGGMGKTRLALALAERILLFSQGGYNTHPYRHGVYFASLARLERADLLLPAIAEAINFRFAGGDNQREQLLRYIANRSMLLVLDNFEHLLAGAGLVDEILRAAPRVKIVITSRARLNRQMEQLFPIKGMAYPPENGAGREDSPLDLNHYSAIQLLVQWARRVRPDFELTAANQRHILEICRLLQGMPLGIVLAASWLESLSTRAISCELQQDLDFLVTDMADVPQRQRSLRAAFNHSWRLLSEREQAIFCQMSVFRGGFTRAAAQAVTGAGLRDLQGLVNKSLLTLKADGRYDVHELLRQFAAEKLSEVEDLATAVRDRHSAYYCTVLAQHTDNWRTARQLDTFAEVTREASNMQAALRWALQQEEWHRLAKAIDSWGSYDNWRGLYVDGERFCQAICARLESWVTTQKEDAPLVYQLWAKAMAWSGNFAVAYNVSVQRLQQSLALLQRPELAGDDTRREKAFTLLCLGDRFYGLDRQTARSCLEQSLSLYEALEDSWGIASALQQLGSLDWGMGHYTPALGRIQTSVNIYQERGAQWEQISSFTTLAWIYQHLGQLAEAEQLRHRVLDLCQQLGARSSVVHGAANLAYTITWQGRFEEARQWAEKGLAFCLEDGHHGAEGYVRLAVGFPLLFAGQYEQAQQKLTEALAKVRKTNDDGVEATVHCSLGYLALAERAYDEAQTAFETGLRLYQAVQDNYIFLALSGLGFATCCRGDVFQSRQYFIELLTLALKQKDFLYLLVSLPGVALYLARRSKVEQALTVWAQAQCQPFVANSQWHEDVVGQAVAGATADLPPEIVEAARENGRCQDIWVMAEALLAGLQMEPVIRPFLQKPGTTSHTP